MIRLTAVFWLTLVAAAGFAMFAVKYGVQSLADQLARVEKQAAETDRDIRALSAEWAYLNRPDALAALNQRVLSLVPIATKQLRTSLVDIPMRAAPVPPPVSGETAVAEAAAPAPITRAAASPATPPGGGSVPVVADAPAPPPLPVRVAAASGEEAAMALDAPATARPAAAAIVRTAARASRLRRAVSLDELIAQITESR